MALGANNRDYKTSGRKVERDLARHAELMAQLINTGMERSEASRVAFDRVKLRTRDQPEGPAKNERDIC